MRITKKPTVVVAKTSTTTLSRVKKSAPKKPKATATVPAPKRVVKPKKTTKPVTKKQEEKSSEEVFVPSTASLRVLEKVEIYTEWYKTSFPNYMAFVAKVGGYSFILAGTLLIAANQLAWKDFTQEAALVCTAADCTEVPDAALPDSAPLVTFANSLPEELVSDTDIVIQIENATNPLATLLDTRSGEKIDLAPAEVISNTEYRYLISPRTLRSTSYVLMVKVRDDIASYTFTGPSFSIAGAETEETVIPEEATTTESTSTTTVPSENLTASSTATTKEDEEQPEDVSTDNKISLRLERDTVSSFLTVQTDTLLPNEVKIYSQLRESPTPLFLGLATLVQGEWVFSLSALDIPKYEHTIYAAFSVDDIEYQSPSILYTSMTDSVEFSLAPEYSILKQKIELVLENSNTTVVDRTAYFASVFGTSTNFSNSATERYLVSEEVSKTIDEFLAAEEPILNLYFLRYGSAVQTNTPYLIAQSEAVLVAHYTNLASAIARELELPNLSTALGSALAERYEVFKRLIIENEQNIKTVTSDLSATDTDGDGISDYDEVALYNTNPTETDTDVDGVTDGIEIINVFDQTVADVTRTPQASLFETGDSQDTVTISSVVPVIVKDFETNTERVYALVQGKTLPHTYVYILSHTTDTVGIIRTNTEGDFLYTIEEEVNDGTHTVSAALADNEGDLVVTSAPYHFTKKANTFAAAAANSSVPVFTVSEDPTTNIPYIATAAVAVIAFGLILLMLAQALRQRKTLPTRAAA